MHSTDLFSQTTLPIAARCHCAISRLLGGLTAVMTSSAMAHPGHRHLEGAPGDMHLHALWSDSAGTLLLLAVIAGAGVLWVRSQTRRARLKAERSQTEQTQAGQASSGTTHLGQDKHTV